MKRRGFDRMLIWLAALVLFVACASSVYIPFSGASWNEILRIDSKLAGWMPFLPFEGESNCTQPRSYWLANPSAWPTKNIILAGMPISQEESLQRLRLVPESSPLESLTAELISTYLNTARGADHSLINDLVSEAEAVIILSGVPEGRQYVQDERTLLLAKNLQDYNEGRIGPGSCPEPAPTDTQVPYPAPLNCSYTLSYWADHPDSWAIQSIQAGVLYTQPAALRVLVSGSTSPDLATLLTRQLIGARLNLAAGVRLDDWLSAIDLSETWLQQHPIGSGLDAEAESGGRVLLGLLESVNQGEIGLDLCREAQVTPSPTPSSTPSPTVTPLECSYPLIYWGQHPDAWKIQAVQAGKQYTREEALNFLRFNETNTDLAVMLTRQLIGARMNIAAGVPLGNWLPAVDLAEDWLQQNPVGTKIDPEAESDGRVLLQLLEKINNGEIGLDFCSDAHITPSPTASLTLLPAPSASQTVQPSLTPPASSTPAATGTPPAIDRPTDTMTPLPSLTSRPAITSPTGTQPSLSPSATATPTPSPTSEIPPSLTPSTTPIESETAIPLFSPTPEPTGTYTPTITATPTPISSPVPQPSLTDDPAASQTPATDIDLFQD